MNFKKLADTSFKDGIPKHLRWHIVYKFFYSFFNSAYYGQIERHLFVSFEHLVLILLTLKRIKNQKKSEINDSILLKVHDAYYDNFILLLNESIVLKLQLKESLVITEDQSELSRNDCSYISELLG